MLRGSCVGGIAFVFQTHPYPAFGRIPSLPHLIFRFYWTWYFQKSTGLRNCLGTAGCKPIGATPHLIPRGRGIQNYQLPTFAVLKQVLPCGPCYRQPPNVGPKIPCNTRGCQCKKEQNCQVVREDILCIHGSELKSFLCCFALANLPKTKILAASCKPILATTHVRFCEAMGSKIPRILSKSSFQRPARKLRN